ncbi:cupin domain-containing protein [Sphingopyxis sp. 22461]|uniref:cupin domain-containing protein n=1 Tax=Sphingopyxis sp. 22461 TaxID=3453923 RepID=UPI003F85E6EF
MSSGTPAEQEYQMDYLTNIDLVVAKFDETGKAVFKDAGPPATNYISGAVEASYLWGAEQTPSLPDAVGGPVAQIDFPIPGGSRFGLVCFPPHSAGKLDMRAGGQADEVEIGSHPGMHRSDSLDYEIVLKGKVDIILEGGARRTLHPGSCLVMAGVMHAWENIYDEPCIYAVVVIGANPRPGISAGQE